MERDRGWAQQLLVWEWRGVQLQAEISRCRHFVRGERHEVLAWCEVRDVSEGWRVEIGSFRDVAAAKAACERHAAARCRRDREERPPVDVRIARGRRRRSGTRVPHSTREPAGAGVSLDDALAAVAWATEDEG